MTNAFDPAMPARVLKLTEYLVKSCQNMPGINEYFAFLALLVCKNQLCRGNMPGCGRLLGAARVFQCTADRIGSENSFTAVGRAAAVFFCTPRICRIACARGCILETSRKPLKTFRSRLDTVF